MGVVLAIRRYQYNRVRRRNLFRVKTGEKFPGLRDGSSVLSTIEFSSSELKLDGNKSFQALIQSLMADQVLVVGFYIQRPRLKKNKKKQTCAHIPSFPSSSFEPQRHFRRSKEIKSPIPCDTELRISVRPCPSVCFRTDKPG